MDNQYGYISIPYLQISELMTLKQYIHCSWTLLKTIQQPLPFCLLPYTVQCKLWY